jgi:hypothetical protein
MDVFGGDEILDLDPDQTLAQILETLALLRIHFQAAMAGDQVAPCSLWAHGPCWVVVGWN